LDSRRKLLAVKARLGEPRSTATRKGEFGFACPGKPGAGGCPSLKSGKAKLWVNPDNDRFNCWVCGFHGGSLAILMVPGSKEIEDYLESRPADARPQEEEKPLCFTLPPGFTPFGLRGSTSEGPYRSYLTRRGVTEVTMSLYRMGYVDTGDLAGRVVVPSFDSLGSINFWSARTIWNDTRPTYKLPHATKNIVSNEHMVDWTEPVYLVEGIFDEMAIGPQAISLYGKFMQPLLAQRLVERRPPIVYVCLDTDARGEAMGLMRRLVGYDIPCALVDLPGKDPGSIGAEAVTKAAELARAVTGSAGLIATGGRL
jgi:hypothetical protein